MKNEQRALLRTILYSDIFNFPLSEDELWNYYCSNKGITKTTFLKLIKKLPNQIVFHEGYYCLKGREKIIAQRKGYRLEAIKKVKIAQKTARNLSYIPTISFIGISGSVALGNVSEADDIDLFIITQKDTLFLTRLFILAILELMGVRRGRKENNPTNKVCVNLIIDETRIAWSSAKRDTYIAHEIAQIQPLFERNGMYGRFLQSNVWITKFLPNVLEREQTIIGNSWQRNYISLRLVSNFFCLTPVAYLIKVLQKAYMYKHKTTEMVSDSVLAFHPYDYRTQTLRILQQKYADFGLLTKK